MKSIQEMTPDELEALTSFVDGSRSERYYYSKISTITEDGITYNGEFYRGTKDSIETIKTGLNRYETYKLFNGGIDMEYKLKAKIDEILSEHITEKFDSVLGSINKFLDNLESSDSIINQTVNMTELLRKKVHKLNLDELSKAATDGISDIKAMTEKLSNEAKPALKELTAVLSQLKRIVTPEVS